MVLILGKRPGIESTQINPLPTGQRPTPGSGSEVEAVCHVTRSCPGLCRDNLLVMGTQWNDKWLQHRRERRDPRRGHARYSISAEIELVVGGQQSKVVVVILERSVKIHPRLIQPASGRGIDQVLNQKAVVTDILDLRHEGIVLRDVVGVVERIRNRVLVGRCRFGVRVWWSKTYVFGNSIAEIPISTAFHISDQNSCRLPARLTIRTVSNQYPHDVLPITPQFSNKLEVEYRVVRNRNLNDGRADRGEIVRADHRPIRTYPEIELACHFGSDD